jgi:CXXX repeat modification system protein
MKKKIGQVTVEEKLEILSLFERRNGLTELVNIAGTDGVLYEKIVADMGSTSVKYQKWWDTMSTKYNWESDTDCHWEINFDTCEIFLSDNSRS